MKLLGMKFHLSFFILLSTKNFHSISAKKDETTPSIPEKYLNILKTFECTKQNSNANCLKSYEFGKVFDIIEKLISKALNETSVNIPSFIKEENLNSKLIDKSLHIIDLHSYFKKVKILKDANNKPSMLLLNKNKSRTSFCRYLLSKMFSVIKSYFLIFILFLSATFAILVLFNYRNHNLMVGQSKEYAVKIQHILDENEGNKEGHYYSKNELFKSVVDAKMRRSKWHQKCFNFSIDYLKANDTLDCAEKTLNENKFQMFRLKTGNNNACDDGSDSEFDKRVFTRENLNAPSKTLKIKDFVGDHDMASSQIMDLLKSEIDAYTDYSKVAHVILVKKTNGLRLYINFKTYQSAANAYFDLQGSVYFQDSDIKFASEERLNEIAAYNC